MNLFQAFKMSCRDATYLHGKEKEGKLSFSESLGLKVHLLYCNLCRLFFTQLDELEKHAHHYSHSDKTSSTLDATAKEKMQHALDEEMKK